MEDYSSVVDELASDCRDIELSIEFLQELMPMKAWNINDYGMLLDAVNQKKLENQSNL